MTPWSWVTVTSAALLGWTWFVYPAAIWVIARLLGSRALRSEPTRMPSVTAIVASRDGVDAIAERVADFLCADYPPDLLSVVVGVDRRTPELLHAIEVACGTNKVRVVAGDASGGKGAGLNAAVREASGDVLVFSDVQQRFAADTIRRLVTGLATDDRLGAIGGALQLPGDAPGTVGRSPIEWYWRLERQLRWAEARVHSAVGVSGSVYAMWRRDWIPMPDQIILDDVWLPMRLVLAGKRVGYDLDAKAWDARSTSAAEERVRKVRTLTGNFQLFAWLPAVLLPVVNPIWVQFVSHKVFRLLTPWLAFAFAVGLGGVAMERVPSSTLPVVLASLGVILLIVAVPIRTRTIARRVIGWGWSLQTAVIHATVNGVRGRWDVWR